MEFVRSRSVTATYPARARVLPFERAADPACQRVIALVAADRGVAPEALLQKGRGPADVALARQLAMYLMHVALGRIYQEVGRHFERDRTTVSHACGVIEDLREDPKFDARVESLEARLRGETVEEVRHARAG